MQESITCARSAANDETRRRVLGRARAPVGAEQSGRRAVVVVSNDGFNRVAAWRSVIVAPLSTSPRQRRRGPTAIALPKGTAGLRQESIVLCHQVTTLDRDKLVAHIGALPVAALQRIDDGLRAALALM